MKQTPIHDGFNADLLVRIPSAARRVIEVGCGSGALAKAYRQHNPHCEYIGIEVDAEYAETAANSCTSIVVDDIERMDVNLLAALFPCSCLVFSDVLEHLYDPWALLRRIRGLLAPDTLVLACIPNAQHWTIQAKLNHGAFRYEQSGLMDITHIRWFTRATIVELFQTTGFQLLEVGGRMFEEPDDKRTLVRDRVIQGIKVLAQAIGADPEQAAANAYPLQWVIRASVRSAGDHTGW